MCQKYEQMREDLEEELRSCIEMLLYNDYEEEYKTLSKNIVDEIFENDDLISSIEMFKRTTGGNLQERSRAQRNADVEEIFVNSAQSQLENLSIEKLNELEIFFEQMREKFVF